MKNRLDKNHEIIKKQMIECNICTEYKGYTFEIKNGEKIARPCVCTVLKKVETQPEQVVMPYNDR